jgi:hypothetical protein
VGHIQHMRSRKRKPSWANSIFKLEQM